MPRFDPCDCHTSQRNGACTHDRYQFQQQGRGVGIKILANYRGRYRDAKDHHQPRYRGCSRAAARMCGGCQQSQQRCARCANAQTNQRIGGNRKHKAQSKTGLHHHHPARRQKSAQSQTGHAQNDKPRALASGVRPIAPCWPGDLNGIMQPHQQPRQNGGHRQFNHHQTVQGRRGQHHNRAQAHLHQTQPNDGKPRQRHGKTCMLRKAVAVIIMPLTYIAMPVALYHGALALGSFSSVAIAQICPINSSATRPA